MNQSLHEFERKLSNYRMPRPHPENLDRILQKVSEPPIDSARPSGDLPLMALFALAAGALFAVLYFTFFAGTHQPTAPHTSRLVADEEESAHPANNALTISAAITEFTSNGEASIDVHFENKSPDLCLIDVWEIVITGLPGKTTLSLGQDLPCTLTAEHATGETLKFTRPGIMERYTNITGDSGLPASAVTEWRPCTLVLRPGDSVVLSNQTFVCPTVADLSTTTDLTTTGDFRLQIKNYGNVLLHTVEVPAKLAKPAPSTAVVSANPVYRLAKHLINLPKEKRDAKSLLNMADELLGIYKYSHDSEDSRVHLSDYADNNLRKLSIHAGKKTVQLSYDAIATMAELRCFDNNTVKWAIATGPGVPHSKYRNGSTLFVANGEVFVLGLETNWTYIAIFKLETGELVFSASDTGQFETREIKD